MAEQNPGSNRADEKDEVIEAADRVIERVEKHAAEGLKPGGDTMDAVVNVADDVDSEDAERVREAAMRRSPDSAKPEFGSGQRLRSGRNKLDADLGPHSDVPEGP